MTSPAKDGIPFDLRNGWPEMLPGTVVSAREAGTTLGSVWLSDAEWAALRRAMVSTLRIDDHPVWHGWTTRHPDGTEGHVEFEIPASPVPVPVAALKDGRSFADWVQKTHGALGRLLVWDETASWWLVDEPDLEVVLTCSASGLVGELVHADSGAPGVDSDQDTPFEWLPDVTPRGRERAAYLQDRDRLQ